ncbi:M23 family metallopeptidase [Marilutibacter alkalisoli]|uniref:M23 family metallopeptidase n=1 Tax=Marilutibacter alkalisoli TaxID=2591633 RepID=UPI00141F6E69|nr:M23 family metallopeptidase [Lysobacter alkalisoli]
MIPLAGRQPARPTTASLPGALLSSALSSVLLLAGTAAAEPGSSFALSVPEPPTAVRVEDRTVLGYELHLANHAPHALDPVRVEVLAGDEVLATYEGEALEARIDRSGLQQDSVAGAPIASGRWGIVFIDIALDGTALPSTLVHRIAFDRADASGALQEQRVEGGPAEVRPGIGTPLSPPLHGGPWAAISDTGWTRGHRRVGYALGGRLRTPGRYAIDWVKLDADGRRHPDGSGLASDAYSHGEDVLAVADGRVVKLQDGIAERRRLDERLDRDRARREGSGNTVVLDLGDGRFAHYAHLRPGSIVVAEGQRVARGEKIAEVGFSGGASAPQLHFAITDGADEPASEGLPFHFGAFDLSGTYADPARAGQEAWGAARVAPGPRTNEMPGRGAVVRFFPAP